MGVDLSCQIIYELHLRRYIQNYLSNIYAMVLSELNVRAIISI